MSLGQRCTISSTGKIKGPLGAFKYRMEDKMADFVITKLSQFGVETKIESEPITTMTSVRLLEEDLPLGLKAIGVRCKLDKKKKCRR